METAQLLLNYDEEQRATYLTVLASLALADGEVQEEEAKLIETMCAETKLSFRPKMQVLNALYLPNSVEIAPLIERLSESNLKYSLLADILKMVQANGELTPKEAKEVAKLKGMLLLNDAQYEVVDKYVKMAAQLTAQGVTDDFLAQSGLDKKFAEVGIPLEAFQKGNTIGEVIGQAALGIASKELAGTKVGELLEIGKAVGGVFAGLVINKNKARAAAETTDETLEALPKGKGKGKKKKKGKGKEFLRKILNKPINTSPDEATQTADETSAEA